MERRQKAEDLFYSGYTCSQSVVLAYEDILGIDKNTLAAVSAPFGGGMGRLREVCGAVSGAFMVLGALYGADITGDHAKKAALYAHVQALAAEVRAENGSIICRELVGAAGKDTAPTPDKRTADYSKKRPCPKLIASVAAALATYLETKKEEYAQ